MILRVLSLDISGASTGWSFIDGIDGEIKYGLIKTKAKQPRATRLSDYRSQLLSLINELNPTHVVIEDVYSGPNKQTVLLLAKFAGVTEECCCTTLNILPNAIHTSKVKSYYKARNKQGVFDLVSTLLKEELSYDIHNDITDAVAQLLYYMDEVLSAKNIRRKMPYGYLYEVDNE